jgi:phage-related tail fiber protein
MCHCNEKNPVGTVNYFARQFAPEGWLLCDGREVSRDVFSDLFNILGISFGTGDGKITFNLPDLRGEFIRGLDEGRGVDKNRGFGTNQKGSLLVGDLDNVSTTNANGVYSGSGGRDEVGFDTPDITQYSGGFSSVVGSAVTLSSRPDAFGVARPRNVALLACIKY